MKLSRYLKSYSSKEDPDHLLLFSTRYISKVLIEKKVFGDIERGVISPENEKLLKDLGILVNDHDDEKHSVLTFFDQVNEKNSGIDFIAVLNLDCNFTCKYCFEGDLKGNLYMTMETADDLIHFIKSNFSDDKNTLLVDFYGGEPLLNIDLIKYISGELKSFTDQRNASFTFSLVTNGSLLKRKTAEELVSLGLVRAKITIDGPPEIHNLNRPFKSGAPSFDVLIKNIKETCDIVKISLGGNFEKDNYHKFITLLDLLEQEGLSPDKLGQIKFDPVSKRSDRVINSTDYNAGCMSMDEPWLIDANELLREEILKRGYNTVPARPKLCMVESVHSHVVNYDGSIYKCPAFIGMEEYIVGNLRDGVRDYSRSYNLKNWNNNECSDCEYLPLCYGGCRYMTFLRDNNVDSIDCQRDFLNKTLETMIRQEIKYGLTVG